MRNSNWIGLDIGGANIKLARSDGHCESIALAMWKHSARLSEVIAELLSRFARPDAVAITMTGELADCFETRSQGVHHIVEAVEEAVPDETPIHVYTLQGEFVDPESAKASPLEIAAANWHAIATYASRHLQTDEKGLLIDIGSTTVDIIPIDNQGVATDSMTDIDRLRNEELLYFGVGRTPLCAVTEALPYRGVMIPVMAEHFATTDDCGIILGQHPENPDDCDSADGHPRTIRHSTNRIARMIGLDIETFSFDDAQQIAQHIQQKLTQRILNATKNRPADRWIISGHGHWLIPPQRVDRLELADLVGHEPSRSAGAFATMTLARESEA